MPIVDDVIIITGRIFFPFLLLHEITDVLDLIKYAYSPYYKLRN